MLIGVKKRFVFVANTKTASTSIETLLTPMAEINRTGSPQRKHIRWKDVRKEYGFLFDSQGFAPESFFKFGVVREPVDWVRSWYNYRVRSKRRRQNLLNRIDSDTPFEAFWERDDWVKRFTQIERFADADGCCALDLIIPYDELSQHLPPLLQRLGCDETSLPRANVSEGSLVREAIADDLADEINAFYAEDFALYSEWKGRCGKSLAPVSSEASKETDETDLIWLREEDNGFVERKLNCPLMETATVAVSCRDGQDSYCCKGAAVLRAGESSKQWHLVMIDADGEHEVRWRLPSPKMASRFPANPHAIRSRFMVNNVHFDSRECVEMWLRNRNGRGHRLFRLGLKGVNVKEVNR